jgi:hypothetical protein
MKKFFIATLIATLLQGTTPAFAASEVSDATSVLQAIVPEIYAQTSAASEVKVSQKTANGEVSVTDLGPGMENSQVSIKMPSEAQPSAQADGLTVVENTDGNFQQVIQPLEVGFRVLNISINGDAPKEYAFELDIPEGAVAELVMGTVRVNRGDEILGSIKEPWAYDGDGNIVETFFTLDGSKVTQHLKTYADTVYPVVSDPNWGYVAVYKLKGSYLVAWERLHTCFNCYFPVAGAPSRWPTYGQLLPLYVDDITGRQDMHCLMNYAVVYATSNRWKFIATKNHLDGLGSTIIFDLRKISSGANQLVVDASIVNDAYGGSMNWYVERKARETWATFADNLNSY